MTVSVLRTHEQISQAHASLESRELAWQTNRVKKLMRRIGLLRTHQDVGDAVKSWDVLRTAEFASKHLARNDPILDIGSFSSEILIVLHRLGFSNLNGLDLNPAVTAMPYSGEIHYRVGNFLESPFPQTSFALITPLSGILPGYRPDPLLNEICRIF